MMAPHVLSNALELAAKGIPVFPVALDKRPLPTHGFKDAATDADAVRALWRQWSGPLVGIRTGEESGLDILDIDRQHGGGDWWAEHRDQISGTRIHRTRSGGFHLLFQHHRGLRCSTSRIAPGIDVKAGGGCCTWWPAAGLPVLSEGPVAAWPDWLLQLAVPPPPPAYRPLPAALTLGGSRAERYARAALDNACRRVADAPAGQRNFALNREVYSLMRLAAEGAIAEQDVADALAAAGLAAGLPSREVTQTLASAIRAGGTNVR